MSNIFALLPSSSTIEGCIDGDFLPDVEAKDIDGNGNVAKENIKSVNELIVDRNQTKNNNVGNIQQNLASSSSRTSTPQSNASTVGITSN